MVRCNGKKENKNKKGGQMKKEREREK